MFVDCSIYDTVGLCTYIDIITCNGDRYPLSQFLEARFTPAVKGAGDFVLEYCEGDIEDGIIDCCAEIQVTLEWAEAGIGPLTVFHGRFTESTTRRNEDTNIIQWRGRDLREVLSAPVIAYARDTIGATKNCLTGVEAAYRFVLENVVAPIEGRGDGSSCATTLTPFGHFRVVPPSADLITRSLDWEGTREYQNLLDVITRISDTDVFDIIVERDNDGVYVVSFETRRNNTATILTECLENVIVTEVVEQCYRFSRVHVLGTDEEGNRIVASVCDDSAAGCCYRETSYEQEDESSVEALRVEGREFLATQNQRRVLALTSRWACSTMPYRDVFLGDIVTIEYDGVYRPYRIIQMPMQVLWSREGAVTASIQALFEEVNYGL